MVTKLMPFLNLFKLIIILKILLLLNIPEVKLSNLAFPRLNKHLTFNGSISIPSDAASIALLNSYSYK
jgi:hypothetical protein